MFARVGVRDRRRRDHLLLTRLSESAAVFTSGLWHLPGGGVVGLELIGA